MLKQCPACEKTTGMEVLYRSEEFQIKEEKVNVEVALYHCKECDNVYSSKELGDPFKAAYDEYRKIKGMVSPGQIIDFRKKYNLTQKELSDLLGFGSVTLSRYENGALQDQAHDNILKLALEPRNFFQLVMGNPKALSSKKKIDVFSKLNEDLSLIDDIEKLLTSKEKDEFTGNSSLELKKVVEVVKYLCFNREVYKTKLMKLLFYSDFLHFKKFDTSITGLQYAHLPLGPVPENRELIIAAILELDHSIQLIPVEFEKFCGEIINVKTPPQIDEFSKTEKEILDYVNSKFDYYTSKDISLTSHQEKGYVNTSNSEKISYLFAKTLSLE